LDEFGELLVGVLDIDWLSLRSFFGVKLLFNRKLRLPFEYFFVSKEIVHFDDIGGVIGYHFELANGFLIKFGRGVLIWRDFLA
jgi:hypothetical protein